MFQVSQQTLSACKGIKSMLPTRRPVCSSVCLIIYSTITNNNLFNIYLFSNHYVPGSVVGAMGNRSLLSSCPLELRF